MTLSAKIINFIRLCFLNDSYEICGIAKVTIMKFDTRIVYVRILENMIDTISIKT